MSGFDFQSRPIDIDAILDPQPVVEPSADAQRASADLQAEVGAIKLTPRPGAVESLDSELRAEVKE